MPAIGQHTFTGTWAGALNKGKLRLQFNISDAVGRRSCTFDSPDQGAMGLPCDEVIVKGDSLLISLLGGKAHYSGALADSGFIAGVFRQGGAVLPLMLRRAAVPITLSRPQTPQPPYGYSSEEVVYYNKDSSIQYGATITIPKGKGPFPALLLITGSGQQDRDESLFGHKPFAVIADYLTNRGYIVLRVDDRGMGHSTGDFKTASSEDFSYDAETSFNYLLSRKETDRKRAGLLGHSEGAMIAPMLAVRDKRVSFIIMLAGPGQKNVNLAEEQNVALLQKAGVSREAIDQFLPFYRQMIDSAILTYTPAQLTGIIARQLAAWRAATPAEVVYSTTRISDDSAAALFAADKGKIFSSNWYHYFLTYDPAPNLEKLSCKVLALNGEKDIQVAAVPNLQGISAALDRIPKAHQVIELEGLNHLFQRCATCTVAEYATLEETISPTALSAISEWLDKNVR